MVSLNRGDTSSTGGAVFFSESSLHSNDSDTHQLLHPVVGQEKIKKFTPLNTIPAAIIIIFLAILLEVLVLVFTLYWTNNDKCEPYFYTLYCHILYWALTFILDFYFKRKHHESRVRGYLEFYQKTHHHSRLPFYVTSIWNAALLAVETLVHEKYDLQSKCVSDGFMTPMNYLCFFITLEIVILIPILIVYVYRVSQFNKHQLCPDVQRDEWMASFIQDSYSAGEVGYRERDNHIEDLLEKQADLLRYLKEQNTRLIQKVLILSTQLKERRSSQFS
ncbi:UNVERIFIED_CONTAM: hypothetical protein PYX00_007149 [Menopon gallinae]|uniref:Transmembrane protein 192 n=1 Tax=Menopon gallinae TaxID=328185 RepID=A0AAW2HHY2_9NEOP